MPANAQELIPDFVVYEDVFNDGALQSLSMHHNTDERTFVEAFKKKDDPEGWYSFSWQTPYTNQETANLMASIDVILGITAMNAVLCIGRESGVSRYDFTPDRGDDEGSPDLSALGVDETRLIAIDIEDYGRLVWQNDMPGILLPAFGLVTSRDIESEAVQAIVKRTVADEAAQILDLRLSAVSAVLRNFMQVPFGEPSTAAGFVSRD